MNRSLWIQMLKRGYTRAWYVQGKKCLVCGARMQRLEARIRFEGDDRPLAKQTRKPVGYICTADGCSGITRTWFRAPVSPP